MQKSFILIFFSIFLFGCSPSPEAIQKALDETQTAISLLTPTQTSTPVITNTPIPTNTPQPTNTPEPTLTPTPDLRIVNGDPLDFIPQIADLPKESQFYLPDSTWTGRHSNDEVIGGWGVDEGREYLATTGRKEGWWVGYLRGSERLKAPEMVYCQVVEYETAEGALLSLTEYNVIKKPLRSTYTWTPSNEVFSGLRKETISYYREFTADSGEKLIIYIIETTYYNYFISCEGRGRKVEVEPDYVAGLVEIVINKMKAAGLIEPPPPTP